MLWDAQHHLTHSSATFEKHRTKSTEHHGGEKQKKQNSYITIIQQYIHTYSTTLPLQHLTTENKKQHKQSTAIFSI